MNSEEKHRKKIQTSVGSTNEMRLSLSTSSTFTESPLPIPKVAILTGFL